MENIYVYFASFRRAAKKANWPQERIDAVIHDAMSSDYKYALSVLFWAIDETQEKTEAIKF